MIRLAGWRSTVPQIFFNALHLGGADDLYALESKFESKNFDSSKSMLDELYEEHVLKQDFFDSAVVDADTRSILTAHLSDE